jgi:hypothetical protein
MNNKEVVWKFRLPSPSEGEFELELRWNYRIVHAGLDGGLDTGVPMPAIWCVVDPDQGEERVKFLLAATGQEWDGDRYEYVATLDVRGYFFHLLRRS